MRARWRRALVVATVLCGTAVAGCDVDGLAFRNDHRVKIVSPSSNDVVHLPFTIRFRVDKPGGSVASYGVFVDTNPPRAGDRISDDADRTGIYVTTDTAITVTHLLRPTTGPASNRDRHEVTVVLLDRAGHRVGESAAWVDFRVQT